MPTIDERVAFLEGKVEEHSRGFEALREAVLHLDAKVDRRLDAVDTRFERVERRIDALDQKVDRLIHGLDEKMSRQFLWMLGVQVTVLLAVIGVLVGA